MIILRLSLIHSIQIILFKLSFIALISLKALISRASEFVIISSNSLFDIIIFSECQRFQLEISSNNLLKVLSVNSINSCLYCF